MFHIEELYYYYTSETILNFYMINNSYCDCILTPDAMPTCISLLLLMLYIAYIIPPFKFYYTFIIRISYDIVFYEPFGKACFKKGRGIHVWTLMGS